MVAYLFGGILHGNEDELLIHTTTWMNFTDITLSKHFRQKRIHTVCFHVYESQKQAKLIHGNVWIIGVVGLPQKNMKRLLGTKMFWASVWVVITWLFTYVKINEAETIEATQVSIDWWMDKQTMVTLMGQFYSTLKTKEILQRALTLMKLEDTLSGKKRTSTVWFHFYEVPRVVKSIAMESRWWLPGARSMGKWRVIVCCA